jgi:hypothetical protein
MIPYPFEMGVIRRLKAEEGWSNARLGRRYLCTEQTVGSWLRQDAARRAELDAAKAAEPAQLVLGMVA